MIRRISVTGPESTGKSWLAENLASHYNTVWVPEFSRSYLSRINRPYNQDDILKIAHGQIEEEKKWYLQAKDYLFCDTDPLVTKIWSDVKYHSCDLEIIDLVKSHRYDLYLLCDIDLPWEFDPLREHPHMRPYLFNKYRHELQVHRLPFRIISGKGNDRLQAAIESLETMNYMISGQ